MSGYTRIFFCCLYKPCRLNHPSSLLHILAYRFSFFFSCYPAAKLLIRTILLVVGIPIGLLLGLLWTKCVPPNLIFLPLFLWYIDWLVSVSHYFEEITEPINLYHKLKYAINFVVSKKRASWWIQFFNMENVQMFFVGLKISRKAEIHLKNVFKIYFNTYYNLKKLHIS